MSSTGTKKNRMLEIVSKLKKFTSCNDRAMLEKLFGEEVRDNDL